MPTTPRCLTRNCSSFPGQGCNATAGPSPGCTCLSMYKVHVPRESPTCPSHAQDLQPGNSAAALFLNKAFEPSPVGKGTGSSFSSPWMVLGDNQSPIPHRVHLLQRSRMSRPMHGRRVQPPGTQQGIWGRAKATDSPIRAVTSWAGSHTRPPCTSQITLSQATPALPATPGGCHRPVTFQLYF